MADQVWLCRTAIHAALELGTDSFWGVIDTLLTSTALTFEVRLRQLFPEVDDRELHSCGRAIRRAICAALLDKSVPPEELRDELRLLIAGYVIRIGRAGQAGADAPLSTRESVAMTIADRWQRA